jgi:hypothetical protein
MTMLEKVKVLDKLKRRIKLLQSDAIKVQKTNKIHCI